MHAHQNYHNDSLKRMDVGLYTFFDVFERVFEIRDEGRGSLMAKGTKLAQLELSLNQGQFSLLLPDAASQNQHLINLLVNLIKRVHVDTLALHLSNNSLVYISLLLYLISDSSHIQKQILGWLSNEMNNLLCLLPRLPSSGQSLFSFVDQSSQFSFSLLSFLLQKFLNDLRQIAIQLIK